MPLDWSGLQMVGLNAYDRLAVRLAALFFGASDLFHLSHLALCDQRITKGQHLGFDPSNRLWAKRDLSWEGAGGNAPVNLGR